MEDTMKRVRTSISHMTNRSADREKWGGRFEFLLSCIGYAVGLGTIWRFPYVCYRNGGGAFLVPYFIYMIVLGMPLVFLEMGFGQFASLSPIAIWNISPLFQGVGIGMVIVSALTCIYYNVIIAWTCYYFVQSFTWNLPWKTCDNEWNSPNCFIRSNETSVVDNASVAALKAKTPSEDFWEQRVLRLSGGIDEVGLPQLHLVICLLISWIFIFLCLFKGVKSSGKVVYITATLPYLLLLILLIRGATLDGAIDGIKFYVIPDWPKLLTFQPWAEAAQQLFYSMGAAWGAWITMASYNQFNNNIYRDAIIVSLADTCTAFISGFAIFSTIGFMAKRTGLSVNDVVTSGPGLVFVVMPEAISHMPGATIWAIIFFIFIFAVGVDSQFGMFETVLSAIFDQFPKLTKRKILVTAGFSIVQFLLGLFCITKGGVYVFQIMDWYCSTFSLMVISFLECVAIAWIYGIDRFYGDLQLMIGKRPIVWWKICWKFITPFLILFVFFANVIMHTPVKYGEYEYPGWAIALGWCFALCSILAIPITAVFKMSKLRGDCYFRAKELLKPTSDWGPAESFRKASYQESIKRYAKVGQVRPKSPESTDSKATEPTFSTSRAAWEKGDNVKLGV